MKRVIVSGYFNPLHGGHLDMIEAGAAMGDYLIVVLNNDKQQLLKKGKVILSEDNRARVMKSLRLVDEVRLSVDTDPTVIRTLRSIAEDYPDDELVFGQGGDRDSDKVNPEVDVCRENNIMIQYGLGEGKPDSSTRINKDLGLE